MKFVVFLFLLLSFVSVSHASIGKSCGDFFSKYNVAKIKSDSLTDAELNQLISEATFKYDELVKFTAEIQKLILDVETVVDTSQFNFKGKVAEAFENTIEKFIKTTGLLEQERVLGEAIKSLHRNHFSPKSKLQFVSNKEVVRFLSTDIRQELSKEFSRLTMLSNLFIGYEKTAEIMDLVEANLNQILFNEYFKREIVREVLEKQVLRSDFKNNYKLFLKDSLEGLFFFSAALNRDDYTKFSKQFVNESKVMLDGHVEKLMNHQKMLLVAMSEYMFQEGQLLNLYGLELNLGPIEISFVRDSLALVKNSADIDMSVQAIDQSITLQAPMRMQVDGRQRTVNVTFSIMLSMDIFR